MELSLFHLGLYTFVFFAGVDIMLIIIFLGYCLVYWLTSQDEGLDESEIKTLLEKRMITANETKTTEDSCAICLLDMKGVQIICLPGCKHHFHENCVVNWLRDHPTCPYCRFNVRKGLKKIK